MARHCHHLASTDALWFALFLSVVGCGGDDHASLLGSESAGSSSTGDYTYYEDTRDPPANDLIWSRCNLYPEAGTQADVAECATFEVPARRNVDSTKTVTLSLKRYRPIANPRGQLWLVNGGPGAGTAALEAAIDLFTAVGNDLEIYLLDHRGTGSSTRLSCPNQEAASSTSSTQIRGEEWQACAAELSSTWGDDLAGFSVTEAATDLGQAIARTRHSDEAVYVYSVSYGTYMAQRYLQLFPEQATGVVLDSICSPGACQMLLNFDRGFDTTAQQVMALCAEDSLCNEQLGSDPYARLVSVADSLDAGHCPGLGWTRTVLRQIMGLLVMNVGLRDYMPALVRRLERCSENDLASLTHFMSVLGSIDTADSSFSQALQTHIVLAELSETPLPTEAEIEANVDGLYSSLDAGPRFAGALTTWPVYATDDFYGQFATTATPLLMLNGELDPQTPLSVALPTGEHFTGTYQHFVQLPYAAHTTLTQSPVDADYNTCGATLIRQFLTDSQAELDESCVTQVLPLDFSGNATMTYTLFGTTSAWNDTATTSASLRGAMRLGNRLGSWLPGAASERQP